MIELTPVPQGIIRCKGCDCQNGEEKYCDLVDLEIGGFVVAVCSHCAHEIVKKLTDRYYGIWGEALMFADAVEAERNECAQVAEDWAEHYPTDVFPADSISPDGISARAMRHASKVLARKIRERKPDAP